MPMFGWTVCTYGSEDERGLFFGASPCTFKVSPVPSKITVLSLINLSTLVVENNESKIYCTLPVRFLFISASVAPPTFPPSFFFTLSRFLRSLPLSPFCFVPLLTVLVIHSPVVHCPL